jgi:hypothetical protein
MSASSSPTPPFPTWPRKRPLRKPQGQALNATPARPPKRSPPQCGRRRRRGAVRPPDPRRHRGPGTWCNGDPLWRWAITTSTCPPLNDHGVKAAYVPDYCTARLLTIPPHRSLRCCASFLRWTHRFGGGNGPLSGSPSRCEALRKRPSAFSALAASRRRWPPDSPPSAFASSRMTPISPAASPA